MFKKKPNIKPLAPIRSSDRRKLADQIIAEYEIEVPTTPEGEFKENAEVAPALTVSILRNSLLPDNSLSARFTTTAGATLKQVSGTVYVGAHPGEDHRILWFKVEEKLIPTVYTLWKHPRLVPLLHTVSFVLEKMRHGSPLMVPGLAGGPPFPQKATKNAIVAVASTEKPSVPMVVGVCTIDVASLTQVQGAKGHAVRSEHWDGDELWTWSSNSRPGGAAPDHIEGWFLGDRKVDLSRGIDDLAIEDDSEENECGGVPVGNMKDSYEKQGLQNDHVTGEDAEPFEKIEETELSTKEIDDAFWKAFLYAIHNSRETHKSEKHHGLSFPIPQSLVMSNLVLPYLPIHTAKQAAALQIKKTSWKNAKKFIKALDKAKVLKSKDRDGGECVVLDIDFENTAIKSFVPYKLPKKDTPGTQSSDGGISKASFASSSSGDPSIGQRLNKVDLIRPRESLSPIFEGANSSTGNLYLPSELRLIITSYIESENLILGTNKRLVTLNPVLANAVFDGHSPLDREVISKGSVPREALIDRIQQLCSPFHMILRNDETQEGVKAKAGTGPKVQIVLETRSGNKTVTKLSGVEAFHISPQLLSDELQKACASSTSVGQLMGSSPKHPIMEILVQGPQKDAVTKALERRGVRRGWIEVVDKTKGKKKC